MTEQQPQSEHYQDDHAVDSLRCGTYTEDPQERRKRLLTSADEQEVADGVLEVFEQRDSGADWAVLTRKRWGELVSKQVDDKIFFSKKGFIGPGSPINTP